MFKSQIKYLVRFALSLISIQIFSLLECLSVIDKSQSDSLHQLMSISMFTNYFLWNSATFDYTICGGSLVAGAAAANAQFNTNIRNSLKVGKNSNDDQSIQVIRTTTSENAIQRAQGRRRKAEEKQKFHRNHFENSRKTH